MELKLNGKNGGLTLVSNEDFDELSKYKWWKNDDNYVCGYVQGRSIRIHRFIMKAKNGQIVDHINGIRYDNRRENLRFVTRLQNSQNINTIRTGTTSKYRGVHLSSSGKYSVSITINGKRHNLGSYELEIDAAKRWDHYVVHNKLDHIQLNFPDKRDEYISKEYKPYQVKKKTNEYIGVRKNGEKYKNKYRARIKINGINKTIGLSNDPIEAARKWDEYVVKNEIYGRQLNFPDEWPEYVNKKIVKTECEEIDDDTVKLLIDGIGDKTAIIDKTDYDKIKYCKCGICKGYVTVTIDKKVIRLHRFLMNVTDSAVYIDHIDSDKMNNTMGNLRLSDASKNARNKRKKKNSSSKYIGVCYDKVGQRWTTSISHNSKHVFSSSYNDEEACARSRDLYLIQHLPDEQYKLNFEWSDDDVIFWKKELDDIKSNQTKKPRYDGVESTFHKKPDAETSSKYYGVTYNKKNKRWDAVVVKNKKVVYKRSFNTESVGARARDLYILHFLKNNGYRLNFEWSYDDISKWKEKISELEHKSSSNYHGVYYDNQTEKWMTTLEYKKKCLFRKRYQIEEHAARARDLYILLNLKDVKFKMNFEWTSDDIRKWKELLNFK